ncbi:hypothetical protein [Roseomonas indoligenes]|uniref:Uncharacterized protein n=1 Tax=Roseomonas indoligenes TaxID=2820811 RepID=A0A940MRS7_9PROT|nr:hypothetical protein [Pararoseomonas indoligenes]MBP0492843.1 hypothetical protein [Pararoseomonas indoligenes]
MPDFSAQMREREDSESELFNQLVPILARGPSPTINATVLAKLLGAAIGGFYRPEAHDAVAQTLFEVARRAMKRAHDCREGLPAAIALLRATGLPESEINAILRRGPSPYG